MTSPAKVAPDKRAVIAEGLIAGEAPAAIRDRLIAAGCSESTADYELRRAEKDPLFQAAATLKRRLGKHDWLLRNQVKLYGQRPADPLPTIDRIDPAHFFEAFYFANRPVKLTGLVDHWPAMKLWSLDYLAETVGAAMVELQGQRGSADDYEIAKERHRRMLPMRDVVAAVRQFESTNEFYVTAANDGHNKQSLAALWEDVGSISVLQPTGGRDGFFWFGPKGTLTPLHHDLTNNLLVQVVGRKRTLLVPPWELPRMRNRQHCFSDICLQELTAGGPDVPPYIECEIGPGDALFLPIGWWHHVEALDVSISMSFTNFPYDNDFQPGHPTDPSF